MFKVIIDVVEFNLPFYYIFSVLFPLFIWFLSFFSAFFYILILLEFHFNLRYEFSLSLFAGLLVSALWVTTCILHFYYLPVFELPLKFVHMLKKKNLFEGVTVSYVFIFLIPFVLKLISSRLKGKPPKGTPFYRQS